MQDINHGVVIGRIATEPKLTRDNYSRLDFSLVFNTTKKNGDKYEDEGNFINLNLWGKRAESMVNIMDKGRQVAIDYHLKIDTWEKDGQKNYKTNIVVDSIQLLGSKKTSDDSDNVGW